MKGKDGHVWIVAKVKNGKRWMKTTSPRKTSPSRKGKKTSPRKTSPSRKGKKTSPRKPSPKMMRYYGGYEEPGLEDFEGLAHAIGAVEDPKRDKELDRIYELLEAKMNKRLTPDQKEDIKGMKNIDLSVLDSYLSGTFSPLEGDYSNSIFNDWDEEFDFEDFITQLKNEKKPSAVIGEINMQKDRDRDDDEELEWLIKD